MTIPNTLTFLRLLLLPLIAVLFTYEQGWAAWLAFGLYVIGALTDWLDGWIARRFNQISPLGTLLDPIADKIYVGAMLLLLAGFDRLPGLWIMLAIVILAREFLIAGLREYMAPLGINIPVSKLAKIKTGVQMIATALLIIGPFCPSPVFDIGLWGLLAATVLTVYTGASYIAAFSKHIKTSAQ